MLINGSGQLGVASSSRRYKDDIRDMGDSSSRLLELRPVTFRYKQRYADGSKPIDYGLIAEEVAEVFRISNLGKTVWVLRALRLEECASCTKRVGN